MNLPALCSAQQIKTREQFHTALAYVNALVKRTDVSVEDIKAARVKAEALRAWASFDKRLTEEDKKEANRAMARLMHTLAQIAERAQPGKHAGLPAKTPGPLAWLMRELNISRAFGTDIRSLVTKPESYRVAISEGKHWRTVVARNHSGGRIRKEAILSRFVQHATNNNSLAAAMGVSPHYLTRELSRIRKIRAWCEAYEHALVQRQSRLEIDKRNGESDRTERASASV